MGPAPEGRDDSPPKISADSRRGAPRPTHPRAQAWIAVTVVLLAVVLLAVLSTFGGR